MTSIRFPENVEDWRSVEMTYRRRNMIPTLGSLDGKHVRIRAPPQSGSLFFNYKGFFSFVLLALVDGDGKFVWVDLGKLRKKDVHDFISDFKGSPGSTNDATIYNNSRLKTVLEDGATLPKCTFWDSDIVMPSFIIADGIFPLSKSLMKPFGRRSLTPEESIYNKKLSNARVRVEHTFGMLAKRFRILDRSIECSYECAIEIVTAMCHLHNLLVPPTQSNSIDSVEECDVYPYKDAKEQREYLKFLLNK
ncbi:hypothetical protein CRE_23869 [Caenorhabditis remanei]|uniref:DDE Tnp4 domain-containing protein n=1 Tax=Caenorhabditis remanei TaxID=31234 RepID=E3NV10_CAERE|nr:hypothetical protein CRE_15157 [Caenorhabditis remanei]EFP04326.1 hypothetical protein CRE_23869 [Caenorhabditis remanei]